MKIENVIKADFFINPVNYGYYYYDDLETIWLEIIKPVILIIEPDTVYIENTSIHKYIDFYRELIIELI